MDDFMDNKKLLSKVNDMIAQQHSKMDAGTVSLDAKLKSEGYIEALYQIENLIANWDDDNESIK